ncbi:tetratricopeptide repeat protein [Candidatus Enterococcus leclercqii]|uniref:tetratricopeptide repeat protein n=1 Tax=Candidatus Enterococcus leclercqii TaxID=1857218 RepID=UPI00137AB250|nr:tetratricopeptide repeat protein [Enterococcus sp. CU9D]KAF1291378.1 hypothetical protein BAU14_00615 [Enterococcus sp. CU9D]
MSENDYVNSQNALFEGNFEELGRLLTAWQAQPEDPHYFDYLNYSGYLATQKLQWQEAEELYDEYLRLAQALQDTEKIHVGLHQLAMVKREQGLLPEAQQLIQQEATILEASFPDDSYRKAVNHYEAGYLALLLGNFPEAHEILTESLTLAEQNDDPILLGCSWRGLGELRVAEGKKAEAKTALQTALRFFEAGEDQVGAADIRRKLAAIKIDQVFEIDERQILVEDIKEESSGQKTAISTTLDTKKQAVSSDPPQPPPPEDFQEAMIQMGLQGTGPVKLIVKGSVTEVPRNAKEKAEMDEVPLPRAHSEKIAVISVVFVTMDPSAAEKQLRFLLAADPNSYYMVYSCPWDTDLEKLSHYPSVAITAEDFTA